MSAPVISEDYLSSLCELTFNSRPHINMLTMVAEECSYDAPSIVLTIETHLNSINGDRLPVLYLIDSIVKNVAEDYVKLFSVNLPDLFSSIFEKSPENMRSDMYKLRTTWDGVFPVETLIRLDTLVNDIDSGWPVVRPPQPTNIHINPDFIKGGNVRSAAVNSDVMRERILKEKKILLELQKKKVELELLQTQEVLEKEQKKLESYTTFKGEHKPTTISPDRSQDVVQPHSSSLREIVSENSKKLLEISSRDPRRKYRQTDLASNSPLSGTSSPIPTSAAAKLPETVHSSPTRYYADDSRDKPPRKKYKAKEKKRHKDKGSSRDRHESRSEGKKKNGHSYKTLSSRKGSDSAAVSLPEASALNVTDEGNRHSFDILLPSASEMIVESSNDVSSTVSEKSLVENSAEMPDISHVPTKPQADLPDEQSNNKPPIECLESQMECGKPTVNISTYRDPRICRQDKRGSTVNQSENRAPAAEASKPSSRDETFFDLEKLINSEPPVDPPDKMSKPLDVTDLFEDMGGTDSVSDLISTLSSGDANDRKVDVIDASSCDSSLSNTKSCSEVASLFSLDETKNDCVNLSSVESPASSTKASTSKRKGDSDDDRDDHKKIILSEPQGSDNLSDCLPLAVPSKVTLPVEVLDQSPSLSKETITIVPLETHATPPSESKTHEVNLSKELDESVVEQSQPHLEESSKDVDLRLLLPRPIERTQAVASEEVKEPNEMETIMLFGVKDVDYRQKPPQQEFSLPSPPPPPVIGNLQEAIGKKSWAQIKVKRTDEKTSPKIKPDRLRRSLSQPKSDSGAKENSHHSSHDRCYVLIKEAEEQLRNNNITFLEYHKMLQEIVSIKEESFVEEAKARCSTTPVTPEDPERPLSLPSDGDNSYISDQSDRVGQPNHSDNSLAAERFEPVLSKPDDIQSTRLDPFENRPVEPPPPPMLGDSMRQPMFPSEPPESFNKGRFDFQDRMWMGMGVPPPNIVDRFPRPNMAGPPLPGQFPPFPNPNLPFQAGFRPRMSRNVTPPTFIPPTDKEMLREADSEVMDTISIGDTVSNVRFYGRTAVLIQSCDNPVEICFPPTEQRRLMVDKRHEFVLQLGGPPVDVVIDDVVSAVQLGAPTRELYIDNKYYSIQFGGMAVDVLLCGRIRSVCLSGPSPIVRFMFKRTDLVAGTVNLYINAKAKFTLFLDGKPQKFYIDKDPCVLKFADSLMTVLINGVPVPLEFGSNPKPVMFQGILHFLRLTVLPYGIFPGQISIQNMESFAHPPMMMPSLMHPPMPNPPSLMFPPPAGGMVPAVVGGGGGVSQQPLDLLASVMNHPKLPAQDNRSYSIEQPDTSVEAPQQPVTTAPSESSSINVNELFQKLLQKGMLFNTPAEPVETKKDDVDADFTKPETLKLGRPNLISKLYSGIQCSSCGIRFPPEGTKMYSRHLDWHFRQNRREKHSTRKPQSRRWYYDLSDWIQYQELDDIDETEPEPVDEDVKGDGEDSEEDMPSVPVGRRKDVVCQVCSERFEEFFNHESEEWHARNAILVEDLFYHPLCYDEFKAKQELGLPEEDPKLEEEEPPPEEPTTVEVIDLDDTDTAVPSPVSSNEIVPLLGPEKAESPDVIALDDNSDSKSEDNSKQAETKVESDDDDILAIEVIERKIDSYELLDDEEEEESKEDEAKPDETEDQADETEEEFDFTSVVIKKEVVDRVASDTVDSSLPTYTSTIDGNIVHETAAPLVVPGRIKINIHRSAKTTSDGVEITEPGSNDSNDAVAMAQPQPPGEESLEPLVNVKPKLMGVEFIPQPTVSQGSELSGLCSIM